jgi:hypothetical protein
MTNLVDQRTLADALRLTPRRIQQLEDRGVVVRHPEGDYDLDLNRRHYRWFHDRDTPRVNAEIEQSVECVDQMLARIRGEPDIAERRRLAEEYGPAIGRFGYAMRLSISMAPEHARRLLEAHTNMVVGRAISELFDLCEWRIDEPSLTP